MALSGRVYPGTGQDQFWYHLPTIQEMAREFPRVDVVDVQTATGPLFHLSIATIARATGWGPIALQVAGSLYGAAVLALAVLLARRTGQPGRFLLVAAPLLLAHSFWVCTLWLNTDVAALLFAAMSLVGLIGAQRHPRLLWLVATAAAAAVATRQIYVWLLVPIAAAIILTGAGDWRRRVGKAAAVCAPAALVLVTLVALWQGLAPPRFVGGHTTHATWAGVSFGAALLGVFGALALIALRPSLTRKDIRWCGLGAVLASAPAAVFPSYPDSGDGRDGGWIWSLLAATPEVAGRAPVLCLLAAVGGAAMTGLCLATARVSRMSAVIVGTGTTALLVAQSYIAQAYIKYYEMPLLLLLAVVVWPLAARLNTKPRAASLFAVVAAIGLQVVLLALNLTKTV